MFDTHTLQREIKKNEQEFLLLQDKERVLVRDIANKKVLVAKYKIDAERAARTAEKYQKDYELIEREYEEQQEALAKITPELNTYKRNIEDLERQFRQMSEDLARNMRNSVNDSGPKQKRYG